MPAHRPMNVKILEKVERSGACIVWTGAKRPNGYGVIGWSDRTIAHYDSPHRVVYAMTRGKIPTGMHIDHLCRNRACVNPLHLEPVTQAENNRRANAARWHGVVNDQLPAMTLGDFAALLKGDRDHFADSEVAA